MFGKETLRVHKHHTEYGHFATITTIDQGRVYRLYRTDTHLDEKSLRGWVKDYKRALRDAMCLWCGDPLEYVTEVDDLDIFGFCSTTCQTEAHREASIHERR